MMKLLKHLKLESLPSSSIKFLGLIFIKLSPFIRPNTIKIILTLTLTNKRDLLRLDVNNAFLNDTLKEKVYKAQPLRFEVSNKY